MRNRNTNNLFNKYREQGFSEKKIEALQELSGMIKILSLFGDKVNIVGYSFETYNPAYDTGLHDEKLKYDNNNEDYLVRLYVEIDGVKTTMSFSTDKNLNTKSISSIAPFNQLDKINYSGMVTLMDLVQVTNSFANSKGYKFLTPEEYAADKFNNATDVGTKLITDTFASIYRDAPGITCNNSYSEIADNLFNLLDYDKKFVGNKAPLFKEIPENAKEKLEIVDFNGQTEDSKIVEEVIAASRVDVVEELDINNIMDCDD